MILETESGSTYEIDFDRHRARRVTNLFDKPPTECFADGWREYARLAFYDWPDGEKSLLFLWAEGAPHDYTQTSPVMLIDGRVPLFRSRTR